MKGRKQYRSMRGKAVDIDLLKKKNELVPAVGNARVNARGDELGPGGKIVRKREEIVREYYGNSSSAVKDENFRSKPQEETLVVAEDLTQEEQELFEEAQEQDEWIEDDDGNFIQKGDV